LEREATRAAQNSSAKLLALLKIGARSHSRCSKLQREARAAQNWSAEALKATQRKTQNALYIRNAVDKRPARRIAHRGKLR
jgi:hypothetical protein